MPFDLNKFKQLANLGAQNSAKSITKLLKKDASILINNISIEELDYHFKNVPPDAVVTSIYLPIRGDITGSIVLLFPNVVSRKLASLLTLKENTLQHGLDDMEISALKEMGNIVCGSFLTVLANRLNVNIVEHLPIFIYDSLLMVLPKLNMEKNREQSNMLLIDLQFTFNKIDILGYIVLIFSLDELKRIEKKLRELQLE